MTKDPKTTAQAAATLDPEKLTAFVLKAVGEFGVVGSAALMTIGDKLGLYRAMASAGPVNSSELAQLTNTSERYVREWLINQGASGVVTYDPATERYTLPPEHAIALTDETSPAYVAGGYQLFNALARDLNRILAGFRTGEGMRWGDHDPDLFQGTERFFRPGYIANLIDNWIPVLDGVQAKLEGGATVADIGCGHGVTTILMAKQFPNSRFFGFDFHPASINRARELAKEAGVADRVIFEVAGATTYPGGRYELLTFFDCLHDMGDPIGAMRYARQAIADDGTLLLVEPMAGETVESNFNPIGRVYSAASVLVCTPNAVATGPVALGTVAAESALREVTEQGGFTRFRRALDTPTNRLFEVRP